MRAGSRRSARRTTPAGAASGRGSAARSTRAAAAPRRAGSGVNDARAGGAGVRAARPPGTRAAPGPATPPATGPLLTPGTMTRRHRDRDRRRGGQGPGPPHPGPVRGARRRTRRVHRGHLDGLVAGPRGRRALQGQLFTELGASTVRPIHAVTRAQANDEAVARQIRDATGVFLTGGNQLRLSSTIGGTRLADVITDRFRHGAVVAGTSAGASADELAHDRVRRVAARRPRSGWRRSPRASGCCRASSSTSTSSSGTGSAGCSPHRAEPVAAGPGRRRGHGRRVRAGRRDGGHRPGLDHGGRRRPLRDGRLGDPRPPPADDLERRPPLRCPPATASTSTAASASPSRHSTPSRAAPPPADPAARSVP